VASFLLASNDYDKELILKIHEKAKEQNVPVITFQRYLLCDIFNIPKDYDAETIYYLMYEMLHERGVEQNISKKQIVRNCFRDYFGMSIPRAKLQYEKKGGPLQQREKRFQVLSFLVTVDAATMREIADQLKTTKKSAEGVVRFNSHYFVSSSIPHDKWRQWRVTEKGRQDYFAIVDPEQTVRELKLQKARAEIEKMKVKAEETEIKKVEKLEKYVQRREEIREKKEAKLAEKRQKGLHAHRETTVANIERDARKAEAKVEIEKRGIQKYFIPDPNSPIDAEIVRRLEALGRGVGSQEERYCKTILCKRLQLGTNGYYQGTEELIEKKLLEHCQEKGKERNDYVRELFCVHFNIKIREVGLV